MRYHPAPEASIQRSVLWKQWRALCYYGDAPSVDLPDTIPVPKIDVPATASEPVVDGDALEAGRPDEDDHFHEPNAPSSFCLSQRSDADFLETWSDIQEEVEGEDPL